MKYRKKKEDQAAREEAMKEIERLKREREEEEVAAKSI